MGILDSDVTQIDPNALAAAAPNPTITVPPSLLQRITSGLNTLNQGVGAGMNSPLFSLGMGMLSAAQPFSDPGKSILGARQAQLQNQGLQQQNLMQQLYFQALQDPQMQAAMNSGGLLPQQAAPRGLLPQQSAPTAGSFGQPSAGSVAMPSAPAASGQPPNQSGVPNIDPRQLYQQGVTLSGSMIPQYRERGQAMMKEADMLLQNDPQNATRMAAAKSELAQDQYAIQQAQASGNPTAMQAAQMRYLTDSKLVNPAAYNGNVTTFGGVTPQQLGMSTFSSSTGIQTQNGQSSLMPGYAGAVAQRAAAQASGEGAGQAPYDLVPVVGPDKQTYMVPKSALLNGGARNGAAGPSNGGIATPGNAPAGVVPTGAVGVARQSPEQSSQQTAAGTGAGEELTELNKQADSARQANYTLDQLRQLGRGVSLGPAAPAREWFEQVATPLAQAFGMQPPKELANYQQINKFGNTLAFNAARAMGSREAAQIVQLQVQSNPQKGLVSDAYNGLIDSMHAMNNYVLAKNSAIQSAASGGQITARQATANWETGVDPTVWDLAVSPQLASRFSGQIGADKIAKAVPFMASEDAIGTMRNIPRPLQAQVLRALPPAAKQEILMGLQASVSSGATGTY